MKQPTTNAPAAVDYKSAKADIWAAYKALLDQKGIPMPLKLKNESDGENWQLILTKVVKVISDSLQEKQEELNILKEEIEKARAELEKTHQIKAKAQTLEEIEEEIASLETLRQKKLKQIEEEYTQEKNWRLSRLKKEEEEKLYEWELKKKQLEKTLELKEKEWSDKEKHYQQLKEEAQKLPETITKTREAAQKETTARLEKDFSHEKQLLEQKYLAEKQLADQQIKNLAETLKRSEEQIRLLTNQLTETHQKIKDLAVAALEAQKPKEEKPANAN